MKSWFRFGVAAALAAGCLAGAALAQEVAFKDPTGDDFGPGTYKYPTDPVYKSGSFDLTDFRVRVSGAKADFDVTVNTSLEDPWGMKTGFAVQMIFIFIQTDDTQNRFTKAPAGLNVQFAESDGWNKCVILSPQPSGRVKSEVDIKGGALKGAVLVPGRTKGVGRTISGSVDRKDLGTGDPSKWGYQVVMQSNEGFPAATDLLTRKVNEFEGQHRFGGGNDGDCDPHVVDCLAGSGTGDKSEIDLQKQMLASECNPDGTAKKMATLTLVRKK